MAAQNRFWFRYGRAASAAILVFGPLFLLRQTFGDRTFMVIYMPIVVYAAFAGGLGPAVLATALCVRISLFFLGSDLFTTPANLIDVSFFAVLGSVLGFIRERLREYEGSRYRQARLQSILDTVPEARIVMDKLGIVLSFGAAASVCSAGTAPPTLRNQQVERNGRKSLDFPNDHRGAWGRISGGPNDGGGTLFEFTIPFVGAETSYER
jgi:two-component system, LuxR family, sensor kinase FixL